MRIVLRQIETGRQALDGEHAQQNHGAAIAGDTQRQCRDQRAACDRVVCSLRGDKAVRLALSHFVGTRRGAFDLGIADKGCRRGPGAGQNADEGPNGGSAQELRPAQANVGPWRHFETDIGHLGRLAGKVIGRTVQHLGQGKQADQNGDQVQPAAQGGQVKVKADHARQVVRAHGGEPQPDDTRQQAFDRAASRHPCDAGQCKQDDCKDRGGAEGNRHFRQGRGRNDQHDQGEDAPYQRCKGRPANRQIRAARFRHRVAIQDGGRRLRRARGVD